MTHRLSRDSGGVSVPSLLLCLAATLFGCDRDAQLVLDSTADAGNLDAAADGSARDFGPRFFDAGRGPDGAPECVDGQVCNAEGGCARGIVRCSDGVASCEPMGPPFSPAGLVCGEGRTCDGRGRCVECGVTGQSCCDGSCTEGICTMAGLCMPCEAGAECRLDSMCLVGTQSCEDGISCNMSGNAASGTRCDGECGEDRSCACDGAGACEACGAAGEACCGDECDEGLLCNGESECESCGGDSERCCDGFCGVGLRCASETDRCFACVQGEACTPEDACREGIVDCSSGSRACVAVGSLDRTTSCGDGMACDGVSACVSCGAEGEPCCGETCDSGRACNATSQTCFTCEEGSACVSDNGCRTGVLQCSSGEPRCIEDDSALRGTRCSAGGCDGLGACVSCGELGEPCCGDRCNGSAACDLTMGECVSCTQDMACTTSDGCSIGTQDCTGTTAVCDIASSAPRGQSCGADQACDGAGACGECGGIGEPCCGGGCDAGVCNPLFGMCVACPTGMSAVPAGRFDMGAPSGDASASADERPVHVVSLPAFCISTEEVTAADYASCGSCAAAGTFAGCNDGARTGHPANCVTWQQASDYCASVGGRLPTEAQWEYAARFSDGRIYPWGAEVPDCGRANFGTCAGATWDVSMGSAPSGLGLRNLAGNVAEWVSDYYDASFYASPEALGDSPMGPSMGTQRVVRGGGYDATAAALRTTARSPLAPLSQSPSVGFRCVFDLPAASSAGVMR